MKRFVLSTVGTSLLTNLISSKEREKGWQKTVIQSANLKPEQLGPSTQSVLNTLRQRARQSLLEQDQAGIRRISAELNGIYGIYDGRMDQANSRDLHWLIATDTAQGQWTAELIVEYLAQQGVSAQIETPSQLSTLDTISFSTGIKKLIDWCQRTIPSYRNDNYRVIFNLVGSFKSLQGYMNTIGMFYADEVVYIFESPAAELIRIPRLPIKVDASVMADNVLTFALMEAGKLYSANQVQHLPDSLLDSDGRDVTLSDWGLLTWNQVKDTLLGHQLLDFPHLTYTSSFKRDTANLEVVSKVNLQEKLAVTSTILGQHNGDLAALRSHGGLQYETYLNHQGVAHFRVSQSIRISCIKEGKSLRLRRYGPEQDVNRNP